MAQCVWADDQPIVRHFSIACLDLRFLELFRPDIDGMHE